MNSVLLRRLALVCRIATMIFMSRFQFSLRQLLVAVVVVAVLLIGARFAFRSHGLAVGLLALVIGAVLLLVVNVLTYGLLRAFGSIFSPEPERVEDEPTSVETADTPSSQ
jgi:uncharacterized membrane protein YqgA involved in biofilm formation